MFLKVKSPKCLKTDYLKKCETEKCETDNVKPPINLVKIC